MQGPLTARLICARVDLAQHNQFMIKRAEEQKGSLKAEDSEMLDEEEENSNANRRGRQDNSLAVLTKRFIQLIKSSDNHTVDLNQAAVRLHVQKRRIYDITNVLQGIKFVEKTQKNIIKWIGGNQDPQLEKQIAELKKKKQELTKEQLDLNEQIALLNQSIKRQLLQNEQLQPYRYITFADIQNASKSIMKCDPTKSMLIISAPRGTILEAGEDDRGACLLRMNSFNKGQIKVYTCRDGSPINEIKPIKDSLK